MRSDTALQAPRPYFGIALQRKLILQQLRRGPATVRQLESALGVRDATARIHELRKFHRIETVFGDEINADGSVSSVGHYTLVNGAHVAQADLFEPEGEEGTQ